MLAFVVLLHPAMADTMPEWAWWPAQTLPKGLLLAPVRLYEEHDNSSQKAQTILVESLAGLAAQGVNEDRCDELVWSDAAPRSYDRWLAEFKTRTGIQDRGSLSPWDLAARFTKAGLVKGYILYQSDLSTGQTISERKGANASLNVATTAAGVLDGILITPEMEEKAKSLGLTLLLDARDKTEAWAFTQFKDKLNPHYLLMQDSRLAENRDLAIAQRITTVYTIDSPLPEILSWMGPMGLVLGWYGDSENKSVCIASQAGEIVVASDFTMNLPVLSAGRANFTPAPLKTVSPDPAQIEKEAQGPAVSFILTDGDNLQWLLGNFVDRPEFWASPDRASIPFGWTFCPGDIDLMAPDALTHLWKTEPAHASFVAHAGYFYPDLFAQNFGPSRRRELLRQLAVRIGGMMESTNVHLLTFICMKLDCDASREAFRIFAREIPGLIGVFPLEFEPYEGGGGKTYWEPDSNGGEVPFITSRYGLRADVANRPPAGSPSKIAQLINAGSQGDSAHPLAAWTNVHAWSGFSPTSQSVEDRVPNYTGADAAVGPGAAALCAKMLAPQVAVVNPEELAWIERWQHDPIQTQSLLQSR